MRYPAGIVLSQIGYERLAAVHGWQSAFFIASVYCFLACRAVLASLALGIFGGGPGGLVMALSNSAMVTARRAFGMGYFFSLYFLIVSLAPVIAGWLFERTNDAFTPLVFGAGIFAMIIPTVFVFALVRQHLNAA
ncbi:hypothetical protein N9L79_04795 [Alphaproteobacteria bacterium]|nr:hypothetical protein [Alphaproteobacteria bacterium]